MTAGDIMTHRTELVAVPDTATAHDVVELSLAEGVSRIPVYRKTLDDIEGIVYVKDLFTLWNKPGAQQADVFLHVYFVRKIHLEAFFPRRARAGVCRARPFGVLSMCRASRAPAVFQGLL